jgi:hypothetical protein
LRPKAALVNAEQPMSCVLNPPPELAMNVQPPSFDLVDWDGGRLQVNRRFSHILEANGLTTCEALLN